MAVDMHIHLFAGVDIHDLFIFDSHGWENIGLPPRFTDAQRDAARNKILRTDQIRVGEVSWMKADLLDDPATYIPAAVGRIAALIPQDAPVLIDEALIERVTEALAMPNTTDYEVGNPDEIIAWLRRNSGQQAFTVNW